MQNRTAHIYFALIWLALQFKSQNTQVFARIVELDKLECTEDPQFTNIRNVLTLFKDKFFKYLNIRCNKLSY